MSVNLPGRFDSVEAVEDFMTVPSAELVADLAALVAALGLSDYDLGGFSLGARTAVGGVLAVCAVLAVATGATAGAGAAATGAAGACAGSVLRASTTGAAAASTTVATCVTAAASVSVS